MLRTDWINRNGSLYELFVLFSNAKDDLFKTNLFRSLINGFWDVLSTRIFYLYIFPFLILFVSNVFYLSYYLEMEKSGFSAK